MNHLKKLLFCCTFVALTATAVFAQEAKNALLIANGDYPDEIGDLPRPIPEAEELKVALKSIGFKVTLVKDADRETMEEALQQFKEKTEKAGGMAFFHYGGHAIQVDGINYLIPTRTNIKNESKVRSRGIKLDEIMESMSGEANIVVLDSCRDNPFKNSRGGGERGLAAVNKVPPKSSIIYSAGSGEKAKDGVFTPILIKKIIQPDKTIEKVFKEVSKEVQEKTANDQIQIPAAYTQLDEDIFLAGRTSSVKILTGSLLINSEFAGIVFIDGEQKSAIKEDGSILIEDLQTGSYTVEVKSDINTFKKKVKISDDNNRAVVSIKTGSIKLTSEVSGKIYLNDKDYGTISKSAPIVLTKLLEGNYQIEVRTESQTFKQEAKVHVGETTSIAVCKPEEPTVKSVSQKKDSYSDDDFYAFGFYGSYNLGISPVYKQAGATNTSQSSHFTTEEKPLLNQGFSAGFTWARFYLGRIIDLQLCTGYTFYYHSFGNEESIIHHEFDAFGLKIGFGSRHIKFHFGAQLYSHWEEVQYASIRGKENTTGTACFGIAPGCGLDFALGNYFSMYAEYRSRITISNHTSFKHSCNIGINLNVLKVRI